MIRAVQIVQPMLLTILAALGIFASGPARADETKRPRQLLVMLRVAAPHNHGNADYGGSYGDAMARAGRRRIAQRIARSHGLTLGEDWPMPLLGVDCVVMTLPDGRNPADVIAAIEQERTVVWAQPRQQFHAQGSGQPRPAGDPLFAAQPAAAQWHLEALHQVASGRGVTVAVIDSRIDTHQPDLIGQIAVTVDFTDTPDGPPESHGTAVAGVIAARENNGAGIVGIAPSARLLGLRACTEQSTTVTLCDGLSLAKALHYAITRDVRIINLSLSGPQDRLLARLVALAVERHETVVAAVDAGRPDGGFPASLPGVVAVAMQGMAQLPPGAYTAPGQDVPTTAPGNKWDLVNGSSFAAAHVSGLFALLRERGNARLFPAQGGAVDACASLLHDHTFRCATGLARH